MTQDKKIYVGLFKGIDLDTSEVFKPGRKFKLHTTVGDYPAEVIKASRDKVHVKVYPLGDLVIVRKSFHGDMFLTDPHGAGGREQVTAVSIPTSRNPDLSARVRKLKN